VTEDRDRDVHRDVHRDIHVLAERVDGLQDTLDERFRGIYERFKSEEKARDETKRALDAKLEIMNEFRQQLNRQAATFVTWPSLIAAGTFISLIVNVLIAIVSHIVTK
jgi:hypothetical protein